MFSNLDRGQIYLTFNGLLALVMVAVGIALLPALWTVVLTILSPVSSITSAVDLARNVVAEPQGAFDMALMTVVTWIKALLSAGLIALGLVGLDWSVRGWIAQSN